MSAAIGFGLHALFGSQSSSFCVNTGPVLVPPAVIGMGPGCSDTKIVPLAACVVLFLFSCTKLLLPANAVH